MNIKDIISAAKINSAEDYTTVKFNGCKFNVKRLISINDAIAVIDYVIGACIDKSNLTFNPALKDVSMAIAIIKTYTDIDIDGMTEDDIASVYTMIYDSDIMNVIAKHINMKQWNDIATYINERIDKIVYDNEKEFTNKIESVYSTIGQIANSINGVFDDIDTGSMKNIIELMVNQNLSESEIAKAVLSNKQ